MQSFKLRHLTLNLLTTTIVATPSNASKWQMGFNSVFKGLNKKWAITTKGVMRLEQRVRTGMSETFIEIQVN